MNRRPMSGGPEIRRGRAEASTANCWSGITSRAVFHSAIPDSLSASVRKGSLSDATSRRPVRRASILTAGLAITLRSSRSSFATALRAFSMK